MATYRDRPWYTKAVNKEYSGQEVDPDDDDLDSVHLNTYVDEWIDGPAMRLCSLMMLQEFQEEFGGWTQRHFEMLARGIRTALKLHLKTRGIYIPMVDRSSVSQQLANLLTMDDCPTWPREELRNMLKTEGFACAQKLDKTPTPSPKPTSQIQTAQDTSKTPNPIPQQADQQIAQAVPQKAPQQAPQAGFNPQAGFFPQRQGPQRIPEAGNWAVTPMKAVTTTAKMLTDLTKFYLDELKFTGEFYDVLDSKLQIFYDNCRKADVPRESYRDAYSITLKGKALKFF
jgi:hypothetical protein